MKKKTRKIVVDGQTFVWSVREEGHTFPGELSLRIWREQKVFLSEVWSGAETSGASSHKTHDEKRLYASSFKIKN